MADRVEAMSWWTECRDREEFARRVQAEQERMSREAIDPAAARMARHELNRAQRKKKAREAREGV